MVFILEIGVKGRAADLGSFTELIDRDFLKRFLWSSSARVFIRAVLAGIFRLFIIITNSFGLFF